MFLSELISFSDLKDDHVQNRVKRFQLPCTRTYYNFWRLFVIFQVYRRWHRKVSVAQKRYAMVSAIAATGVPALVMAKGKARCSFDLVSISC